MNIKGLLLIPRSTGVPASTAKECVLPAWCGGVGGIGATTRCVAFLVRVVRRVDILEECKRVELHREVQEFFLRGGSNAKDDGWEKEEVCDGGSLVAMPC